MKTIGQATYEAWLSKVTQPPRFSWDQLPKSAQDAWEEIAEAAVDQWWANNNDF